MTTFIGGGVVDINSSSQYGVAAPVVHVGSSSDYTENNRIRVNYSVIVEPIEKEAMERIATPQKLGEYE